MVFWTRLGREFGVEIGFGRRAGLVSKRGLGGVDRKNLVLGFFWEDRKAGLELGAELGLEPGLEFGLRGELLLEGVGIFYKSKIDKLINVGFLVVVNKLTENRKYSLTKIHLAIIESVIFLNERNFLHQKLDFDDNVDKASMGFVINL